MIEKPTISRREFLRLAGYSAAAIAGSSVLGTVLAGCTADRREAPEDERRTPRGPSPTVTQDDAFSPDTEIILRAVEGEAEIFPGTSTRVWRYEAEVVRGREGLVEQLPDSYLGPILRVNSGEAMRVHLENGLTERTIVHWHGLHVPPEADGHPMDAIEPGETYTYDFQVRNRAGTYWFHPHPHTLTGPQVYRGLAGLFLVSDEEEANANLPSGEFDLPLVIQDRTFDRDNQLVYLPNGLMDRMMGFLGDRILVNGKPDFELAVSTRPYRLRLLNGSNSRIYKLAWDDGTPLIVIGTDGGLLERPVQREYVTLGPAERVELWVDFSRWPVGAELRLKSLPFYGGDVMGPMGPGGMGPGGMGGSGPMGGPGMGGSRGDDTTQTGQAPPNGAELDILTVRIDRESSGGAELPETLSAFERYNLEEAANAGRPRTFTLAMAQMQWTINGRTFEMEGVAEDEIVRLGDLEVWEFANQSFGMGGRGGMMGGMMQMAHPMHIHGLQFQVLERQIASGAETGWDSVRHGYVDEGWKDSVLVMPGETVRLLLRFEDFTGLYLYHCHILEHEDLGMMRNYLIEAASR